MEKQDKQDKFIINKKDMIHLACLRGNIGYWTYYSTVIKVKDIVSENRIITVAESDELYTTNINKILQREINNKRIKNITKYINNSDERFFSSLIVAIHEGTPKWTDIDLFEKIEIDDNFISEEDITFLGSKYGILSLMGNEEIFALDGQHRLKGLRKAYAEDNSIADLEIPLIFVIHNHNEVDKTRRLFTVLNKYAEKPRGAELIILDEDDAAAINARRVVMYHPVLSKPAALSSSKTGAISASDQTSLTTLVTIYNINKKLYSKPQNFYTTRPSDEILDSLFAISTNFWDSIFETFPELVDFIDGNENVEISNKTIERSSNDGGSLLLRPVGQELLANAFNEFYPNEIDDFKQKLRLVDFSLNGYLWKYLFWNEKMLGKESKLKKSLLLYVLGKFDDTDYINDEMTRIYELNNQEYLNNIEPI
ncbi:DNA sulfur modification protein DndB [Xanthomarina gelatinilytica]|uniref:DNA sulfur modification protein DndB n=1 Tax=Xanthomarina gelatinilytica TaxID=1137281 RepID=UPI003AA7B809